MSACELLVVALAGAGAVFLVTGAATVIILWRIARRPYGGERPATLSTDERSGKV